MQIFDKYYTSESNDKNKSTNNGSADEDVVCTRYLRVVYPIVAYRIPRHCITGPKSLQLFCCFVVILVYRD
jgi:hypothetical protein